MARVYPYLMANKNSTKSATRVKRIYKNKFLLKQFLKLIEKLLLSNWHIRIYVYMIILKIIMRFKIISWQLTCVLLELNSILSVVYHHVYIDDTV